MPALCVRCRLQRLFRAYGVSEDSSGCLLEAQVKVAPAKCSQGRRRGAYACLPFTFLDFSSLDLSSPLKRQDPKTDNMDSQIPDWEATAMEPENGPYQGPAHSQMSPVLQTPAMLDRDSAGELWQIPLKPIILKTRTMVRERHNVSEPSTLDYHAYCSKIVRAWHVVEPKAWLPEHICKDTPYSLALLSQLARLASRTLDSPAHAHELLTSAWRGRQTHEMSLHTTEPMAMKECFLSISREFLRADEAVAQELPAGLLVRDVDVASGVAASERTMQRKRELSKITPRTAVAILDGLEATDTVRTARSERKLRQSKVKKARKVLGMGKAAMRTEMGLQKSREWEEMRLARSMVKHKPEERQDGPETGGSVQYDQGETFELPVRGA